MMSNNFKKIMYIIISLLFSSIANAIIFDSNIPTSIVENEFVDVNISIMEINGFSGTVYFSYDNIISSNTLVSFSDSNFIGEFFNYTWPVKGGEIGQFEISLNLTNSSGDTLAVRNKFGNVRSSIPRILSTSPSGLISDSSITLRAETDENAICNYDSLDTLFENMSKTFSETGDIIHTQSFGANEGINKIYVRCQDDQGFSMNESEVIEFEVDSPPTAQISLSDSSPVKEGTVEVTLITSENMENTPILEYSFDDDPTVRYKISLTGQGSYWNGYLIVTPTNDNKVGTFYFKATDESGNIGTRITNDNLFLVDTSKPPPPRNVKAAAEVNGNIKVKWYYDGEKIDYYNIYRSTNSGTNFVDFYAKANDTEQFFDGSTINKVTYYYKVSAVDKAGNEGSLSQEVFATSLSKVQSSTKSMPDENEIIDDTPKVLPPDLVPKVNTFIKQIDKLLIDVKALPDTFDSLDQERKDLANEMNLGDAVISSKSKLEDLRSQLEGYKQIYATEAELDDNLKRIDMEAKKIEKTTPKNLNILEKTQFFQTTSKLDIEIASNELFADMGLTEDEIKNYVKQNYKNKDKIKVETSAKIASIEYLDGTSKEKSFIKKRLTYEDAEKLEDVIVVEIIPKSIASDVNEISFIDQKFDVLNPDPIVKFGFLKFDYQGEEILYTLDKIIDMEELKNSKSVVLLNLNQITSEANKVTGFSIFPLSGLGFSKTQLIFFWIGIITILLLFGYYFIFVKDYQDLIKKKIKILSSNNNKKSLTPGQQPSAFNPIDQKKMINNNIPENSSKVYSNSANNFQNESQIDLEGLKFIGKDNSTILQEIYSQIKAEKTDLAFKLYPVFAALQNNLGPKDNETKTDNFDFKHVNDLIEQAHGFLTRNQQEKAVKLYPQIDFFYQNLPKSLKPSVYEKCINLHRMINRKN